LVKLNKLRLLVALTVKIVAKKGVGELVKPHYPGLLAISMVAAAAVAIMAVLLIAGSA
jgi:hypothetical protein